MQLRKLIRDLLAALAFATPNFARGKEQVNDTPVDPITDSKHKFAPGGTVAEINKYEGFTIAGGPGSQKIGDTFDALPQHVKDRMIAARKGIIRRELPGEDSSQGEGAPIIRRSGTDAIAHALATRYDRSPTGRLTPKKDYKA